MDAVLTELRLTPKLKLELVLKYTQTDHYDRFPRAVELWELALRSVLQREQALRSLRRFELLASDPRRHFRSLSTQRLREEKQRDLLFSKLNQASEACTHVIQQLTQLAGDTVYLNDRIYSDKMKKDYTELLYEVEQERLQIIYQGVRPHVASAVEEEGETREEDEEASSRPAPGRTVVSVRVPTISPLLLPRPPPKRVSTSKTTQSTSKSFREANQPELTVEGETTEPTDLRYRLTTDRESIFVAVRDLDTIKRGGPKVLEAELPLRRASTVAEQVQKQRQAELQALARQHEAEVSLSSPHTGENNNSKLDMQTPRIPEKALKKRVSSLQELFKQLLTRPKS
ncbi:hypothetical protein BBJ28_00014684 [Nothophytophthora sp. Chile5]|nr:hypothetical protein BBJ28_00014684 [Nothophytophthora sp. Chile5]